MSGCGTDNGYRRHRRNGEDACPACRKAHARQVAESNYRTPERAALTLRRANARNRALARLKAEHSTEYRRYYAEEMDRSERGEAS